jgi:hypothetical protein
VGSPDLIRESLAGLGRWTAGVERTRSRSKPDSCMWRKSRNTDYCSKSVDFESFLANFARFFFVFTRFRRAFCVFFGHFTREQA